MTAPRPTRQRGFALLIVLWTLGLLALLIAGLATAGRNDLGVAANTRGSAVAEAAADGAVQQAVFQLHLGTWLADGLARRVAVGRTTVQVTVDDLAGRINPNLSSPSMLAALLGAVGADPAQALLLARAMVDWRTATPMSLAGGLKLDRYRQAGLPYGPPGRPFSGVDEIGQVPGITAALLAQLRPYVSVYQSGDAQLADNATIGRAALRDAEMIGGRPAVIGFTSPDQVVLIRATATLAGGTRFVRRAIVRLPAQSLPGEQVWQILTWDSGQPE